MDTLRQSQAQKIMVQSSTSTAKPNIHRSKVMLCIWWDQKGVVYYELLKPELKETITGEHYRQQLMQLHRELKEKQPEYTKDTTKSFSSMTTLGHMSLNRSRKR